MAVSPIGNHPATSLPPADNRAHSVVHGDTLWAIAAQNGVSLQALIQANPQVLNPDLIYPGDRIQIPAADAAAAGGPEASPASFAASSASGNVSIGGAGAPGDGITGQQLLQIVPGLDPGQAPAIAQNLNAAMAEANINTPQQQAMFIAQLAHESGGFRYMEEIASGAAYEGRADLGNTQPGDGVRYKGRGYIQVTGRYNYTEAGRALGLDLVNNPQLAAQPENAARIAAWYWTSRDINTAADSGDFVQVTRLINGGTNGLADRQAYYARAQAALA